MSRLFLFFSATFLEVYPLVIVKGKKKLSFKGMMELHY